MSCEKTLCFRKEIVLPESTMLCGVNLTGRRKFREQKTTSTDVSVDTIEEKALKDHSSSNEKVLIAVNNSEVTESSMKTNRSIFQRRFLTPRKWRAAFDVDGRLVNLPKTFRAILEGVRFLLL